MTNAFVMFFDWDILNGSQLADASFPHLRGKSEFYLFIYLLAIQKLERVCGQC